MALELQILPQVLSNLNNYQKVQVFVVLSLKFLVNVGVFCKYEWLEKIKTFQLDFSYLLDITISAIKLVVSLLVFVLTMNDT